MHDVNDPFDIVLDEAQQLRLSGHVLPDSVEEALSVALAAGDPAAVSRLEPRVRREARLRPDWPYDEPDALEDILRRMPKGPRRAMPAEGELAVRISGMWLGRCAGCTVGKPVEGMTTTQVRRYLRDADAWPLRGYIPAGGPLPDGVPALNPSWPEATLGNVDGVPRDDDIDYTILALHLLETRGRGFARGDVAHSWLDMLPFLQVFTAERAVYRNLVAGIPADEAAGVRNPYREWIGALIRADLFGAVCPGDPAQAVRLAHADASLTHTGNGLYGAMWVAALVAEALVSHSVAQAVERSLLWVPHGSRLRAALDRVVGMHAVERSWDDVIVWIDEEFREHSWVHVLNNAAVIAAGLLWGGDDAEAAIGLTVQAGYDTDSAAATVGSVVGAVLGREALPDELVAPLGTRVRSAVRGYDGVDIDDLAARTVALALR